MWKKKLFGEGKDNERGSSFFSSGFYGASEQDAESPTAGRASASARGVLPPPETVARAPKLHDRVAILIASLQKSHEFDALRLTLKAAEWQVLAEHLQPFTVQPGQEVIRQGATEAMVYIIESGALAIYADNAAGDGQLAKVGAGSIVGEGAFFSRGPRSASVVAMSPCLLWGLSPMRFTELSYSHPQIALSLVMAFGSVVTRRLTNSLKKMAVT